jgi:hypothetical protein
VVVIGEKQFHLSKEESLILSYSTKYFIYWSILYLIFLATCYFPILKNRHRNGSLAVMGWVGFSFILLFLCLVILTLYRNGFNTQHTAPYIVTVSIFSTLTLALGWIIHVQNTTFSNRKSHTLNVLLQTRINDIYQNRSSDWKACFGKDNVVKIEQADSYLSTKPSDLGASEIKALDAACYLLDFYDFIAIGIMKNDLDEDLFYESHRQIVKGLCLKTRHLLEHVYYTPYPKAWIELKTMNERWEVRYKAELRAGIPNK